MYVICLKLHTLQEKEVMVSPVTGRTVKIMSMYKIMAPVPTRRFKLGLLKRITLLYKKYFNITFELQINIRFFPEFEVQTHSYYGKNDTN